MSYQEEHNQLGEQINALCAERAFAPHCDQRVLHTPGTCWSCDGYPDWQAARLTWGINFTGENNAEKLPCPAELRRTLTSINSWGGNRSSRPDDYDVIQPVPGEDYALTVAKHFRTVATPVHQTPLQRARRRLYDIVHNHHI